MKPVKRDCMYSYDFLTLLGFWDKALVCIDCIPKKLQGPSMNFHYAALDLKALQDHFDDEREMLDSHSKKDSVFNKNGILKLKDVRGERNKWPTRSRVNSQGGNGTLDCLHREMDERFAYLHDTNTKGLCYGSNSNDLKKKCKNLGKLYSLDVDGQAAM